MHEPLPEIKPAKISDSTSANDSGDGEDNADTPSAASSEALDSAQHRKNLNSLAQRKFRAKIKEAKEESARERVNRLQARSAYAPIEPTRIHEPTTLSGLPWGGVGLNYILMAGMRSQAMEPDKIDSDSGSDPTIYGGDLSALEDSSCQDQDLESSISSLGWPSASSVASADEKPDLDTKMPTLPYPCDFPGCNQAFRYPKDLRRHEAARHEVKKKEYFCSVPDCPLASKGTMRRDNLKRHMKRNHPDIDLAM